MDDRFLMKVIQGFNNFPKKRCGFLEGKTANWVEIIEERASIEIFKNDADRVLVFVEAIEFNNVRVI